MEEARVEEPADRSEPAPRSPCPEWCLNDCDVEDVDHHEGPTTAVRLGGRVIYVGLQQPHDQRHPTVDVLFDGQGVVGITDALEPAQARSLAAHLLHHADLAEGLGG